MLGRHHHLALHQPAGGILVVLSATLDRDPVDLVERAQDPLLLRRLHVLGEVDDVVGLELLHRLREDVVGQLGDDLVAHPLLELGQHRAVELPPQSRTSARRSGRLICSRMSATSAGCSGSSSATSASWSSASTASSTASTVSGWLRAQPPAAVSRASSSVSLIAILRPGPATAADHAHYAAAGGRAARGPPRA